MLSDFTNSSSRVLVLRWREGDTHTQACTTVASAKAVWGQQNGTYIGFVDIGAVCEKDNDDAVVSKFRCHMQRGFPGILGQTVNNERYLSIPYVLYPSYFA